mgnify:CR=1 FL=1
MIIYYHNDLDGRCAAAIAWRSNLSDGRPIQLKEVDYKDSIDLDEISPGETVLILDFSFKTAVMNLLLQRTGEVIWIDHHKTAIEDLKEFESLKGYRISDKYSGCELTWMYFNPNQRLPLAAALIGDYDKWALNYQPKCFEFYEGLKMENTCPQGELWTTLFSEDSSKSFAKINDILDQGQIAIKYRDSYCSNLRKQFGYEALLEKLPHFKIYACNMYLFGSKGFGELFAQYDIVAAYIYDGYRFTVSFYSDGKVDVGTLCKQLFNGGGHSGAAGFVCKELPFRRKELQDEMS